MTSVDDGLESIKRHNARVEQIQQQYQERLININELMAEAYRERERQLDESWQEYKQEQNP
jgi:F0F1-type ATP synthase membrane subunit b/b'